MVAAEDPFIYLYNTHTKKREHTIACPIDDIQALAFSDGDSLLTAANYNSCHQLQLNYSLASLSENEILLKAVLRKTIEQYHEKNTRGCILQ